TDVATAFALADRVPEEEPVVRVDTPAGVTLIEGASFCASDRAGDIHAHRAEGVFFQDTRIVSVWRLTVDGARIEPLGVHVPQPGVATFVGRAAPRPDTHDGTVV